MNTMLYITDSMIPARSANSIQVMRMSQAFAQCGVAVELIVPWQPQKLFTQPGAFLNMRRYYGLKAMFPIKFLPGPGNVLLGENWRTRWFLWLTPRYLWLRKPDIVYTRNLRLAALLVQQRIAVAVECHEYERFRDRGDMSALLEVANSAFLRLIVVISHSLKRLYVEFGFPESKILVAHDGVDESLIQVLEPSVDGLEGVIPKNRPVICYAGKFSEDRGIGLIVEAARALPQAFFLLVGGTKKEVAVFQKKAEAERLTNMQFVGFVSPKEVAGYLRAADVLVAPYTTAIPTLNAASPLKVFEYMATGKPAVLSDIETIGEVITDGYDGILVEPDSSAALIEGVQRALSVEGAKIGANARQTVKQYTWQARAEQILKRIRMVE